MGVVNCVTDSVIKIKTPPAEHLYVSFSVIGTSVCLTYYWLLLLWLSSFTNCTVAVEQFTIAFFNQRPVSLLAFQSSHLKGSFQEAAASMCASFLTATSLPTL